MELEIQQLSHRIEEMMKNEAALNNEVEILRQEVDKKSVQYNSQTQSEKDLYKQRMNEAEKKAKEADARRS